MMAHIADGPEPIPAQILDWLNSIETRLRRIEVQLKEIKDNAPTPGKD